MKSKKLTLKLTIISLLIMQCIALNVGCFTAKVNDLVYPENIPEKVQNIEKAIVTDSGNIFIEIHAIADNKKNVNIYRLFFNYRKIIDNYQSWNSTKPIVEILPDDYNKSGIHSYYQETTDSIATFVFYFSRDFVLNNNIENMEGKDISNKLKIYDKSFNKSYIDTDAINLVYLADEPESRLIILNIANNTKVNKWAYVLYPFSIIGDIVTFPVQLFILIKNYKHPFKN